MLPSRMALSVGALCALLSPSVRADSTLSGVCPDGSFFVVQSRASVPCANPHFADPDQLPPVRPYLLPRPYTWYVDQEARNPNNPYNLTETARKIREAREGLAQPQPGESACTAARNPPAQPPAPTPSAAPAA